MKVSVIIPTYRRPQFLMRAINSALQQTHKDIEVIVVSDNNPDDEYEKETLKVLASVMSQIKYLPAIGNQGGPAARNRGLEVATGDYVNFLDDDDEFLPTKIEEQLKLAENTTNNLAVIGCQGVVKDGDGKFMHIDDVYVEDSQDILFSELVCNIICTPEALVKTDVCKRAGGFGKIVSSQEHLFFIRIFSESPTFAYVNKPLVNIYWHEGSRVSTNTKKPLGALELTKIIYNYLPCFDKKKQKRIRLARMKQDLYAYVDLKDYAKALRVYAKMMCQKPISIDNLKVMGMICLKITGKA